MTKYNVHLYREMRLVFDGIEAGTPEAAAAITRDMLTRDAVEIDDCEGMTLSALVDVDGDEKYEHSVIIDFEEEKQRKDAPALLAACRMVVARWEHGDLAEAARACSDAIAATEAAGIGSDFALAKRSSRFEIENDPAENSDRILTDIARQQLGISTLEPRSADSLDFHDVSVWGVKNALRHAYQAGLNASSANPDPIQKQLTSNGMFHTPGLFRALQNDYRINGKPRLHAIKTLSNGYGLSREEAAGLLSGAIKSEIDDAAGTVTFTSRCETSPAASDPVQSPYSVLLLYPDYANDTGYESYYALVEAADPIEAVTVAQRQAVAAQSVETYDPTDFHPLLVTQGHQTSEPLFNK